MRAVVQTIPGATTFVLSDFVEMPVPGERQVLIRIQYAGVNENQMSIGRAGLSVPTGASQIPGLEVAGYIVSLGVQCECDFKENDLVFTLLNCGGYAEYCVVDERLVVRALPGMDLKVCATIPLAFMTAYQICFMIGKVQRGDSVLIHDAASNIGQAAIQMMARKGVNVYATVNTSAKKQLCIELGCKNAFIISPTKPKFCDLINHATDGGLVNVIFDCVGAGYIAENIETVAVDGKIVLFGLMTGSASVVPDTTFLGKLLAKRITLSCSTMRSRSIEYKEKILKALDEDRDGFPALTMNEIRLNVDHEFKLDEVLKAHQYVESHNSETFGRVVLNITSIASGVDFFEQQLDALLERNKYEYVNDRY